MVISPDRRNPQKQSDAAAHSIFLVPARPLYGPHFFHDA